MSKEELKQNKTPKSTLMLGDCLERMKEIESGSVDMILTDPPYELSKSKGGGMMGKGGRKFMEEVNDADMVNGIDISLLLNNAKHYLVISSNFAVFLLAQTSN
jgi:DNA modification methylase